MSETLSVIEPAPVPDTIGSAVPAPLLRPQALAQPQTLAQTQTQPQALAGAVRGTGQVVAAA